MLSKIRHYGFFGSLNLVLRKARRKTGYDKWRCRNAPRYANPTVTELLEIEKDLRKNKINVMDYKPPPSNFAEFKSADYFPDDYVGGIQSGVWEEKLLDT